MRQPLTDGGECGPDDSFDVFIWKGHCSCLVNVLGEEPKTPWDDRRGFMVLDPWVHTAAVIWKKPSFTKWRTDLAADDWYESPITFEMFCGVHRSSVCQPIHQDVLRGFPASSRLGALIAMTNMRLGTCTARRCTFCTSGSLTTTGMGALCRAYGFDSRNPPGAEKRSDAKRTGLCRCAGWDAPDQGRSKLRRHRAGVFALALLHRRACR